MRDKSGITLRRDRMSVRETKVDEGERRQARREERETHEEEESANERCIRNDLLLLCRR